MFTITHMCSLGSAHRVTQALGIMVQMVTEVMGRSWKSLWLIAVHLYTRKFQKEPDSGNRLFLLCLALCLCTSAVSTVKPVSLSILLPSLLLPSCYLFPSSL